MAASVRFRGGDSPLFMESASTLPEDWKKFHADNVARLNPELRNAAVAMLRKEVAPAFPAVRKAIADDPQEWWVPVHFHWGMAIRNLLRDKGFGEASLGVDNLDDCWVGLVELAATE